MRRGFSASFLKGTNIDAARLLDCASPASPVPAHIEILWKFLQGPVSFRVTMEGSMYFRGEHTGHR
jgi:hypothetical protein